MKKIFAVILLLTMLLTLCACRESEQIDEIAFVKVLGLDKTEDGILLTAGMQGPKPKEQNLGSSAQEYISVTCETVSQGLSLLEAETEKKIFFGQINSVLFGEEFAKHGILDTVDYLVGSDELRFDIPLVVVKNTTASKLIENGSEEDMHVSEKIEKLLAVIYSTSISDKVEMSKVVNMLEDPFRSVYLPYVQAENGGKDFSLEGFCVFRGDKMLDYLSPEISRGVNFLNDNVENAVLVLTLDDARVSLKISKCKTKKQIKNGIFKVDVSFTSEILQADSGIDELDEKTAQRIIEKQNGEIKKLLEGTVEKLKDYPTDCAGFGKTFENKSPKEAKKFEKNWNETFGRIKYEINVESKIDPSKTSGKPVKQGGD